MKKAKKGEVLSVGNGVAKRTAPRQDREAVRCRLVWTMETPKYFT